MSALNSCFFRKTERVIGNRISFRNASAADASYIVHLRNDPEKGKYLSKTSAQINDQIDWLERYSLDEGQIYFIIENLAGSERYGTVRLYDQREDSFCWGSWIIQDGAPTWVAVESALMVYEYALSLGFKRSHFDVRKNNESVWRFHERFGASRTKETEVDYFYAIDESTIMSSISRYRKFLPNGIAVRA